MHQSSETPLVTWNYLPITHVHQAGSVVTLTLTDERLGFPVRLKVAAPEDVELLQPYLDLFRLEQQAPWTNGPAYLPVQLTADSQWTFSLAGARYDYPPPRI